MILLTISSQIWLLVLATSAYFANAVPAHSQHGNMHRGPSVPYTPSGVVPISSEEREFRMAQETQPAHPALVTPAPSAILGLFTAPAVELPTPGAPPRPAPPPRPPFNNKHGIEEDAPTELFGRLADKPQPVALSTTPMPLPPAPPVPNRRPQGVKPGLLEPFALRSGLMVRSLGADGGAYPQSFSPNGNGVSDKVFFFFLFAMGFFFLSMIWNFYFQFGIAQEKAKVVDERATAAMRLENLPHEGEADKKSPGQESWLKAANAAPGPPSPV